MTLEDSLPLQRFCLPAILADGCCFAITAGSASFVANVVSASSTASTVYVNDLALALAHRWRAFAH